VPNVKEIGSLNLLEPSGPHRACYGTPLPLLLEPIPVAVRSKAKVCGHSLAEIEGSIALKTWMSVSCEFRVLSGRGLCDGLITRPEESYRVWGVSAMRGGDN